MKEFSFGQYYPEKSFVHKLDARVKILLTIALIVAVFLVDERGVFMGKTLLYIGFIPCALFILIAVIFAKIPFKRFLGSIKGIVFFVVLSAILQLLFNKQGTPLWENGFITDEGVFTAVYIFLRIVSVVLGASLLTLTTSPVEIADGIESLLTPLKIVKFPVHEFALVMSIALRFIPTLTEETDRIIKAQSSRGADFESGNVFKRAKALIPVLIPLLISSFRRADELADAMDARCYAGSKKRTKFKKMHISYRDFIAVILTAGLIVSVVLL